jgi:hypothetical protein
MERNCDAISHSNSLIMYSVEVGNSSPFCLPIHVEMVDLTFLKLYCLPRARRPATECGGWAEAGTAQVAFQPRFAPLAAPRSSSGALAGRSLAFWLAVTECGDANAIGGAPIAGAPALARAGRRRAPPPGALRAGNRARGAGAAARRPGRATRVCGPAARARARTARGRARGAPPRRGARRRARRARRAPGGRRSATRSAAVRARLAGAAAAA